MKVLSLRVSDDDYERFRSLCSSAGVSIAVATRDAILRYEVVLQNMVRAKEGVK